MSTNFALPQEFDTRYFGPEHAALGIMVQVPR